MTRDARDIRVLCEQRETETRLDDNGIKGTVLFFGSARSKTKAQFAAKLEAMKAAGEDTTRFAKTEWMCDVHENLTSLAEKVGTFLKTEEFKHVGILTGGGPGMMEAANQGAFSAIPERSIGMGISLPFEPSLNPFVTPDLAFEFQCVWPRARLCLRPNLTPLLLVHAQLLLHAQVLDGVAGYGAGGGAWRRRHHGRAL
jgi:predicted Rossmann-fold nucleotide-binding protein